MSKDKWEGKITVESVNWGQKSLPDDIWIRIIRFICEHYEEIIRELKGNNVSE